jgi:hypothetical protein
MAADPDRAEEARRIFEETRSEITRGAMQAALQKLN